MRCINTFFSRTGDIFLRLTPFLKFYTAYSNNFDKSTQLVKHICKQNRAFAEFLDVRSFLFFPSFST